MLTWCTEAERYQHGGGQQEAGGSNDGCDGDGDDHARATATTTHHRHYPLPYPIGTYTALGTRTELVTYR